MIPNNTFKIYFDGGAKDNRYGYGSWEVEFNGFSKKVGRENYGETTNNVAEYQALLNALNWLRSVVAKQDYKVEIYGDSKLVLYQILQRWKTKKPHLRPFRDACREILSQFSKWTATWQPRIHSVHRFGH